jgi:predicted phage baseplate assembly protein
MPLPDLNLDDRTFADLLQQLRLRVPRYTPEWTDLNDSDPGITLAQLFAWLTEMTLYRLNQVPEKNYRKFLELVGIALDPPQPAGVDLTFTPSKSAPGAAPAFVTVPQHTKVDLAAGGDGGPVTFETDDDLYAVRTNLAGVQGFDGARFTRVEPADLGPGKSFYPFGQFPQAGSALYLGFDQAFPAVDVSQPIALRVYLSEAAAIAHGEALAADTTDVPPPAQLAWEYYAGTGPDGRPLWRPLTVTLDQTAALTASGDVRFVSPGADHQQAKVGLYQGPDDVPLYWLRCRLVQELGPGYLEGPLVEDVLLNTIAATNAVTVGPELLGASNGMPNQQFQLANVPVLPGTLTLEVWEDDDTKPITDVPDFEPWTEVDDFADSGPDDKHYTLDPATGIIAFGDGEKGKIPQQKFPSGVTGSDPAKAPPPVPETNVQATSYRSGGGSRGNAGAGTITTLRDSVPGIDSVTNERPSEGGKDQETIDQVKQRAPQELRTGGRAVSAEDFEYVATRTPGANVRRAKALPGYHPDYAPRRAGGTGGPEDDVTVPGVVTVLVVPDAPEIDDPGAPLAARMPEPTEETLRQVGKFLLSRCPVTTEVYVGAPHYRKVEVSARVIAAPRADLDAVRKDLVSKLLKYFDPLTGGDDGRGWDFGQTVYFSSVYRLILTRPNVLRLADGDLTLFVDDVPRQGADARRDVALRRDEVVYSQAHDIFVDYE